MKIRDRENRSGRLISNENVSFAVKEAYNTLRTNLKFALKGKTGCCVAISSAMPGDGKSTICANLGISLADTDAKVLIMDGDLRKPVQHKFFNLSNEHGLSDYIAGLTELKSSCKCNVYKNLSVITSGPVPPNPSELLGSESFKKLVVDLEKEFDYILIDTPPINLVTDALVFPPETISMILICKTNQTTYDQYNRAISSIKLSGLNLIGTIMNGVDIRANKNYRKGYKYYEY